jgi:predicted nucleic acid-binding protein
MTRRASPPGSRARERAARYIVPVSDRVVVDASIAFLWFANEPDPSRATRLLDTPTMLLAPDLMAVEATNAWWKKLRRREMTLADVEEAVTNLLALGIAWTPAGALLRVAARLASELGHPVYDCIYLSLAFAESARLATADERLRRAAQRLGIPLWAAR